MLILKTKSRGMSRVENNFNVNLKDHKQKNTLKIDILNESTIKIKREHKTFNVMKQKGTKSSGVKFVL